MDEYCELNGFTAWYETSARDNINIDEAANTLVKKVRILYYVRVFYFNYILLLFTDFVLRLSEKQRYKKTR